MSISNELIKNKRRERGWSQEQLATISGLSERTVQRIEKEGKCSLESKMALASAFEISPAKLDNFDNSAQMFEENRIDWASTTGYIILLLVLPVLIYFLTNTHGIWEIGCLLIVDGLTLALAVMSHGSKDAIFFFSNTFLPIKRSARLENLNGTIIRARQIISYCYTIGSVTCLVYILVTLAQTPERLQQINVFIVEAATPLLYSVLIVELWIRPFKHKLERLLAQTISTRQE